MILYPKKSYKSPTHLSVTDVTPISEIQCLPKFLQMGTTEMIPMTPLLTPDFHPLSLKFGQV